jgi:hypothetical protein
MMALQSTAPSYALLYVNTCSWRRSLRKVELIVNAAGRFLLVGVPNLVFCMSFSRNVFVFSHSILRPTGGGNAPLTLDASSS